VWAPTIEFANRDEYEAHMSAAYGANITIIDFGTARGARFYAAERASYNPISVIWDVLSDDPNQITEATFLGVDTNHNTLLKYPDPIWQRLLEDKQLVAHPRYTADGLTKFDHSLIVSVPYCGISGCGDANDSSTAIEGLFDFVLKAEFWGKVFPDSVAIWDFNGGLIKTGRHAIRSFVTEHEPVMDIDLKCHYTKRSLLKAAPYFLL
jgi:hypothetical protein